MKTLATLLVLCATFFSYAQNFQPFNDIVTKRFHLASDPTQNEYFYYPISSSTNGDTSFLQQYYSLKFDIQFIDPGNCPFWGGPTGETIDTTWLGNEMQYIHTDEILKLTNKDGDPLDFDFSIAIGDSSLFFSAANTFYYIVHTSQSADNIYSVTDQVKHFEIRTYDGSNAAVPTPLTGFDIQLSENHGLISFINTFELPQVHEGLELSGQLNPTIGSYHMTMEELYPWQAGDVLQYHGSWFSNGFGSTNYQKITITDRTESADSIWITFDTEFFVTSSNGPSTSGFTLPISSPLALKKTEDIMKVPHDYAPMSAPKLVVREEGQIDTCAMQETVSWEERFAFYCDSCRCFGNLDGFGSSNFSEKYTKGFGMTRYTQTSYGPLPTGNNGIARLVYANIGGIECGQIWLGIDEFDLASNVSIAPNPTNGEVNVESDFPIERVTIINQLGQELQTSSIDNIQEFSVDLTSFKPGAYFMVLSTEYGDVRKRIIRH